MRSNNSKYRGGEASIVLLKGMDYWAAYKGGELRGGIE